MPLEHLEQSFCIDSQMQMPDQSIAFAQLKTDKPQHVSQFYHIRYNQEGQNAITFPYYGAKVSNKKQTFGGDLPLINEFISSTILFTINELREEKLFQSPRVLLGVIDNESFRLFSRIVPQFSQVSYKSIEGNKSSCYLAGLATAIQEVDPNPANYGLSSLLDESKIYAKIDTNTDFITKRSSHGGIYFNNMKRPSILESIDDRSRDYCSFATYVAKEFIFETMRDNPDRIKFVADETRPHCLKIKKGQEENFKYFMLGVKDFLDMPKEFNLFLQKKIISDIKAINPELALKETANIEKFCGQFLELQKAIGKYFQNELSLFNEKFPEYKEENIWNKMLEQSKKTPATSPAASRADKVLVASASKLRD